jgi:hypothetical protein
MPGRGPESRIDEGFKFHQEKSTTVCNPELVFLDLTFFSHLAFSFSDPRSTVSVLNFLHLRFSSV